jgi:hypothetical protein
MVDSLLLLELSGSPHALAQLERQLGELIEGPRVVAVYLGDRTPEEVLAVCAAHRVRVCRSRVIAASGPSGHGSRADSRLPADLRESQPPARNSGPDRGPHQSAAGTA